MTLYANGVYECGATLVHKYWILTHRSCSNRFENINSFSGEIVIASAGGFRDSISLGAHVQVR